MSRAGQSTVAGHRCFGIEAGVQPKRRRFVGHIVRLVVVMLQEHMVVVFGRR